MNDARSNILKRLKEAGPGLPETAEQTPVPLARWSPAQRIERFSQRMESVRAEVHIVPDNGWIDLLKELVSEKGIGTLLYSPPTEYGSAIGAAWGTSDGPLRTLTGEIEEWQEQLFSDIDAALTSTHAAIAETGTLVLWPDSAEPRTFSLVPPIHIALLKAERIFDTFADLVAREQWQNGLPTNALLISGPSKSADIEQTLAYGVHGPVELIVLVLTEA
ncbi:MAG: lactate utilization protein [Gammaproteobacteria bacterium]|nr:lactate utilization protein [Gammaproteobacteria bacterium]